MNSTFTPLAINTNLDQQLQHAQNHEDVTEVFLINQQISMPQLSQLHRFNSLQMLVLDSCGLTNLRGFPYLSSVLRISLNDNLLTQECLVDLSQYDYTLKSLSLVGNLVNYKLIRTRMKLMQLSLQKSTDNAEQTTQYRKYMFNLIPTLVILDGITCPRLQVQKYNLRRKH